ncbi:MAG: S41 family peptidase [Gammaproteobacteria bacterium]
MSRYARASGPPRLRRLGGCFALLCVALACRCADGAEGIADPSWQQSAQQRHATVLITRFVENYHFRKHSFGADLSMRIHDRYLQMLDPDRSFFVREDLQRFAWFRLTIPELLVNADLDPAIDVFRTFQARVDDRVAFVEALLAAPIDFEVEDRFRTDRHRAPWVESRTELDVLWRRIVKMDYLALEAEDRTGPEIVDILRNRYRKMGDNVRRATVRDVHAMFINAYLSTVDEETAYSGTRQAGTSAAPAGAIGVLLESSGIDVVVAAVVPGSGADRADALRAGDAIVSVGEGESGPMVDVVGWGARDVAQLLEGPVGTRVRLQVRPRAYGSIPMSIRTELVREPPASAVEPAQHIVLEARGGSDTIRVGVIGLRSFYADAGEAPDRGGRDSGAARDVRRSIDELGAANIDGLILDLRGNRGGLSSQGDAVAGLFLDGGPIMQVFSAGRITVAKDPIKGRAYAGPLAVLIDRGSGGAAEAVAAAVQDYRRGIVIGETSAGSAGIRNLIDLDRFAQGGLRGLGTLRATIGEFHRVSGAPVDRVGVAPDVELAGAFGPRGRREARIAQPSSPIRRARFKPERPVDVDVAELNRRHLERAQSDAALIAMGRLQRMAEQWQARTEIDLRREGYRAQAAAVRDGIHAVLRDWRTGGRDAPNHDADGDEEDLGRLEREVQAALVQEAVNIMADYIGALRNSTPTASRR